MKSYLHKILFTLFALFLFMSVRGADRVEMMDSSHLIFGIPKNVDLLLMRRGFSLGYSDKYKQALWVSYILKKEDLHSRYRRRSFSFRKDPAVKKDPVHPKDYRKTGYDRGHLAPAGDMSYHLEALKESFYMTNISPQYPACNRGIWKKLEQQVRIWAEREGKICVVTGPVFKEDFRKLGKKEIPIPAAFYKVILDMTPPLKMIGFVIPNTSGPKELSGFAMSIREVERLTGNTFFHLLQTPDKKRLKENFSYDHWIKNKNDQKGCQNAYFH